MAKIKLELVNGDRQELDVSEGPPASTQFDEMLAGGGPLIEGHGPYRWVIRGTTRIRLDAIATARLENE